MTLVGIQFIIDQRFVAAPEFATLSSNVTQASLYHNQATKIAARLTPLVCPVHHTRATVVVENTAAEFALRWATCCGKLNALCEEALKDA